jgi:acyl carrier protein
VSSWEQAGAVVHSAAVGGDADGVEPHTLVPPDLERKPRSARSQWMSVTTEVGNFIASELSLGRDSGAPAPDEDLLAKGLVDSHGVMELIVFLEERYRISIADEELTPENFQSLVRIEEFVASKTS